MKLNVVIYARGLLNNIEVSNKQWYLGFQIHDVNIEIFDGICLNNMKFPSWECFNFVSWTYTTTSWIAVFIPTDCPKSVRNCCVIKGFGGVFVLWLSVGVRAFVMGLSKKSSLFSYNLYTFSSNVISCPLDLIDISIFCWYIHNRQIWFLEKRVEIWRSRMTNLQNDRQYIKSNTRRHKTFYYTMITDRLMTVSWRNNSYPTGIFNLGFKDIPSPLLASVVQSKRQKFKNYK